MLDQFNNFNITDLYSKKKNSRKTQIQNEINLDLALSPNKSEPNLQGSSKESMLVT
jgi:hypothetical protein